MATEKTHLLQNCVVNIPKQIYPEDIVEDNWRALTLEELMPFIDDPFWRILRTVCFIIFWTSLIVILIITCIISLLEINVCNPNKIYKPIILAASNTILNSATLNQTSITLERMSFLD